MGISPVYDFDEMIESPIPIRLLKKDRVIKPVNVETYFKFINGFSALQKKPGDLDSLVDGYYEVFRYVIEPIERSEILQMDLTQIAALFIQVYERIGGKSQKSLMNPTGEDEKKKLKRAESMKVSLAEMIASACLLFHWTPEIILKMPVRQFFAVLKQGQRIDREKKYALLYDLTDVASCAQSSREWVNKLKKFYLDRTYSGPRILPTNNDKIVSKQLLKMFKQAGQNG